MENNSTKIQPRDGTNVSLWQTEKITIEQSALSFNQEAIYDALIIGGGITGVTTALLLQQQGKKCVLAEANSLGFGTTGGTTAHLNTFFDAPYPMIEKDFGEDAARLVAASGKEAFTLITDLVKQYNITCDLEYKDGYLFAQNDSEGKELDEILTSSKKAGVDVLASTKNDVPVPFIKAVVFPGQGQFHPLKYINGLAQAFIQAGGIILQNTMIRNTSSDHEIHIAESDTVKVKAKNIVYATHMPPGINMLDFTCAPYRSYALGIRLNDDAYPTGLAYDMKEPYHYFRTHIVDGEKYLVLGGEDHKTGHDDPEKAFENLEAYARQHYDIASVDYKWSAQYYVSNDALPFIGQIPGVSDNIYTGTGYNGNGMIFGTLAAKMISDTICSKKSFYADLYSPSRIKPIAGFQGFIKENADVAYHFISDRFSADDIKSLQELKAGTGTIVNYKGKKLAIYKSTTGEVHALNPVCTHAKCIVNFNKEETSWDCPCHGGRFDIDGRVLTGPPRNDLQKVEIE